MEQKEHTITFMGKSPHSERTFMSSDEQELISRDFKREQQDALSAYGYELDW